MHLESLKLRDYRNYDRLDVPFQPGFHLFLGDNAQGKTNLLEAIYLLATLRSFRGVGGAQLVRHGQKGYFASTNVVGQGRREIKMYWSAAERRLTLNGQSVKKLSEFLGVLRAVVFCSEDTQLVKGPSQRRRRFLDLLLTQTDSQYLPLLQRYMRAVRARNTLLKQPQPDTLSLQAFTHELITAGTELVKRRTAIAPKLAEIARSAYAAVSSAREELFLEYKPSAAGDLETALAKSRPREKVMRQTLVGPHRDDLRITLDQASAAQFGSEGQKRTIAIALKMAQAEFLSEVHGTAPILLIDDVMGELDARRRTGLMPLLEKAHRSNGQVFMTCTEENWPGELSLSLHRWKVASGKMQPLG